MIDAVLSVMQEAAETAILPRFRALQEGDVENKSLGEVVTVADREAEAIITPALRKIRSDAVVVGEEASAADPALLAAVAGEATAWLVDPLDGTANFVDGSPQFGVMVALIEAGVATHAWIWRPLGGEAWIAQRGAGATLNGARVLVKPGHRVVGRLRGAAMSRFLEPDHRLHAETAVPSLGETMPGIGAAAFIYPAIAANDQDFALFRRTLPWDHVPGALLLREAGGIARRWDGREYHHGDDGEGLIVAADEATWQVVAEALLLPQHRVPR